MLVYIVLVLYVGLARCSRVIRSRKLRSFHFTEPRWVGRTGW